MIIKDGETASDLYNGTASQSWVQGVSNFFGNIAAKIGEAIANFQIGDVKFGDWYRDDPLGATAGAVLGGTAMYFGGKLVLGVAGTVSRVVGAVRSLGVMGAARAGAGAALRSVGGRALALLGSPGALATRWLQGVTTGALIRWCTGSAVRLLNFNFQATNESLDSQVTSAQNSLWGIVGAGFGATLGAGLCGIIPGAAVVRFNPAKLAAIKEVDEELYEEIIPQIKSMVMGTINVAKKIGFTQLYKNVRKVIKSKSPFIRQFSPSLANTIDKWGEKGSKPWTINGSVEEKIETIPDEGIKAYYENLWEEFVDSCQEALMVFSTAFG
ncbi:hypothetical protein QUA41_30735 [Microcoleus sp. Pol11C1]|uniref:hypothetical protein n=1 Tax=unclassified Microcoleus TaxID=2642155 RepID=UPI002FCF2EB3